MKRIFGKAKLELILKVVEHGEKEISIYELVIEKLIAYLGEKYQVPNTCRFLPIPEYFKTLEGTDKQYHTSYKMIITKNMKVRESCMKNTVELYCRIHSDNIEVKEHYVTNSGGIILWFKAQTHIAAAIYRAAPRIRSQDVQIRTYIPKIARES